MVENRKLTNKEELAILRLFKSALVEDGWADYTAPSQEALKVGVYISSSMSADVIANAIKLYGRGTNENETFHKSLFKVANADFMQLYYEQILHYFSTYGAEELGLYSNDTIIIPKEKLDVPELESDTELIVIRPITAVELSKRLSDMITVDLALSTNTVRDVVELSDYLNREELSIKDDYYCKVENREVRAALYGKYGILPKDGQDFLRYALAKLCDRTLLIKDKETIKSLKRVDIENKLDLLNRYKNQYGLIRLAEVFHRYKPLFLAFKSKVDAGDLRYFYYKDRYKRDKEMSKELNTIINTIRRLSDKYHKPVKLPVHQRMLEFIRMLKLTKTINDYKGVEKVFKEEMDKLSIYKFIKVVNYLRYATNTKLDYSLFKIRNGKIYIEDERTPIKYTINDMHTPTITESDVRYAESLLADRISKNVEGKTIYIPSDIKLKLPQSEKQFSGNIPFGSSVEINKQPLLVGIHWFNKVDGDVERRVDLDLHLVSDKYTVGWNSSWRDGDNELLYTGDNTSAPLPNGASEFIYIGNNVDDTLFNVKINNYTTDVYPLEFELIIAKADDIKKDKFGKDYIVDPNKIITKIPIAVEKGKSEQVIGVLSVKNDIMKFIFTDMITSNRRVSTNKAFEGKVRDFMLQQSELQLDLDYILAQSKAIITTEPVTLVDKAYVLDENNKLITQEEADEKGLSYTEDEVYFKKEEKPVDIDFSLNKLTKDSFIQLLKEE